MYMLEASTTEYENTCENIDIKNKKQNKSVEQ